MKGKHILLLLSLMTFATSMAQNDIVLSCPDDNHPHAIDLGLPSGTKWACCNVGADKPEEYGHTKNTSKMGIKETQAVDSQQLEF